MKEHKVQKIIEEESKTCTRIKPFAWILYMIFGWEREYLKGLAGLFFMKVITIKVIFFLLYFSWKLYFWYELEDVLLYTVRFLLYTSYAALFSSLYRAMKKRNREVNVWVTEKKIEKVEEELVFKESFKHKLRRYQTKVLRASRYNPKDLPVQIGGKIEAEHYDPVVNKRQKNFEVTNKYCDVTYFREP